MRQSTLFFVFITAGVGLGLFQLKYKVMNLEQDHSRLKRMIRETDEAIHVLRAEWAHLNDPKRLQSLCERYLAIAPIRASQLVSLQHVTQGEQREMATYDRGAMDQLVANLVSDTTSTALQE